MLARLTTGAAFCHDEKAKGNCWSGSYFPMCEDLSDKIDDIFPVDQKICLDALKRLAVCPGVPFAAIYTMRLLCIQFFREREDAANLADEQLSDMYSAPPDDSEAKGDPTPADYSFSITDFATRSNAEPPEHVSCGRVTADQILGPQKVRCD